MASHYAMVPSMKYICKTWCSNDGMLCCRLPKPPLYEKLKSKDPFKDDPEVSALFYKLSSSHRVLQAIAELGFEEWLTGLYGENMNEFLEGGGLVENIESVKQASK